MIDLNRKRQVMLKTLRYKLRQASQTKSHQTMRANHLWLFLSAALISAGALAQRPVPDGYNAIVEKSSRMKAGEQITLANVHAGQDLVVWPSGNAEPTTRVFQEDEFVVLVFVAKLTGGTETFYLNTKTMRFTLIEATFPFAAEPGFRPGVTQGILRRR